ncbi:MAG: SsrA-binding protein SmpB [Kofleriaceae bacterium]|nr:SsrA-binding protein SmpB [Kofleriaceae bacterium]
MWGLGACQFDAICYCVSTVKKPEGIKVVATNRKAHHDFVIHERLEAGLVLVGSEVKSLREARTTIPDGWVEIRKGEAWLHGITINEYAWANRFGHDTGRTRKLLLHKAEILKLGVKTQQRGYTLIPLQLYIKEGRIKVELGLVTHKKQHDKRDAKREADDKREIDRAMKDARKR